MKILMYILCNRWLMEFINLLEVYRNEVVKKTAAIRA